jgi:predicted PurR-regulated permease PerM
MTKSTRISYVFIALTLVLVAWLQLATPLLAVMFSLFVLNKMNFARSKWLAVSLFVVVIFSITYAAGHFLKAAVIALPKIADTSIPSIIGWAQSQGVELPFTDYDSLKTVTIDTVKEQVHYVRNAANFARGATREFAFLVIGIVVAVSLFLNSQLDLDRATHKVKNNLYSLCCEEIGARFWGFYESFARVMGAQIVISTINTLLTSIFVVSVRLPFAPVVIGVTFLCGLLPVIGNLISNAIIVGVAFTVSPKMALAALVFLVVIHKLEYFLNSKIIGDRIRSPVWLTLLGLVVGERLMGLPGMILAPVILNYVKVEASRFEVAPPPSALPPLDSVEPPTPLRPEPAPLPESRVVSQ